MNNFPGEKWIKERQWEYYNIQIHTLLSNKINKPEHQELINLYNQYCASDKIVPIQLQEYINMNSVGNDISKSNKFLGQPLNNYKKVLDNLRDLSHSEKSLLNFLLSSKLSLLLFHLVLLDSHYFLCLSSCKLSCHF